MKKEFINSVNLNAGTDFPYLVLNVIGENSYPRNPGFQVMHWHEDLQYIYVFEGIIEVRLLEKTLAVHTGQGIFINQNVIHNVKQLESCHYNSFLFPAYFLKFYAGGPAEKFVDTITAHAELPYIHFHTDSPWHTEILNRLRHLSDIEDSRNETYPYEVLNCLCTIWLIMIKNTAVPEKKKESVISQRMQKLLAFIESNYSEDITLADISRSADISKSECARCFKISMGTTPYKYLVEYRLSKAAQLLKQTDEPVGNIVTAVGFRQMSHFGKCFREKTGYSPKEYRKAEKGARQCI